MERTSFFTPEMRLNCAILPWRTNDFFRSHEVMNAQHRIVHPMLQFFVSCCRLLVSALSERAPEVRQHPEGSSPQPNLIQRFGHGYHYKAYQQKRFHVL
jgi:hypothetical protein